MKILKIGILTLIVLVSTTVGIGSVVAHPTSLVVTKADVQCLAKNIYMEARGETLEGQIAVAQVTMNRVRSPQFRNTVCGVVYAPYQFSWTIDKTKRVRNMKAWQDAQKIAKAVLSNTVKLPNFNALYFHTHQVNPRWNRSKRIIAVIGNHIFYA